MRDWARAIVALVAAFALVLTVAACGSSDDDGGGDGAGTSGAATAPADSGLPAEVTDAVREFTTRPTSIGIDAPIEREIPTGKEIYYIQCGSPVCATNGEYLRAAADAVGWKVKAIKAGVTPESVKAAWGQAAQDKPDGVVASGFPRTMMNPELAELEAARVPVVDISVTDPPGRGISAVFAGTPDYVAAGERLAKYALVDAGGKDIKAMIVGVAAYPTVQLLGRSFGETIERYCDSCSVDELDVPATSIGNDLPTRISTYLQAHPDVNWVVNGFADMSVGVPAALQSAGVGDGVKFVGINNNPTTAGYLKAGQSVVAEHIYGYPELMWRAVDFLIRSVNGESTDPSTAQTYPHWVVTKDTIPSTTDEFPTVEDYRAQYERLWGVG
ncbi:substrate-binding domain-containing protein [Conexibacter sp. JD483]|uniref:sugar ABC transporter substrate-binding protein n=1 Tax=unclassified Conexibacter TaxID=2627773 RepID=UPI00271F4126|nr:MULTISPECIES: substrate-binding domain-containing protein [unclassified Conexibacter]MDO8186823.1 substrate-binding domain-containing protein [Conexibacter sp. CPCC 205706]MDO8197423.1 substrate-binding domain-containing protein [Conexibacter sp. CPCC 205762]MDR9371239.1 substrate-binding domain-containing protein [Conexibacter sp. JD483]